jgi:diacylglycerol O-acyltransferase / wax synthase
VRAVGTAVRSPRRAAGWAGRTVAGLGAVGRNALSLAPATSFNRPVGPHRRFSWQRESLDDVKAIKDALEGSVNDVVLTAVAGALGAHLRASGEATDGLELQIFVPVALRSAGGDETGNEVSGLKVPLPVGFTDPLERFARIHAAMEERKDSAEVVAGRAALELSGLAPPALGDRLTRLGDVQRYVNLVVTNVPGPQDSLYLLGRELEDVFPLVPLGANLGLGVAITSYAGAMFFGFTSDPDVLPDIGKLPGFLHAALVELGEAAGVEVSAPSPAAAATDSAGEGQPWPGYDNQTVAEIRRMVSELDSDALARVRDYERRHKDRVGVRRAVEAHSG